MAEYNIIVKAMDEAKAREVVDIWLSAPTIKRVASLGYNEFIVAIESEQSLDVGLADWQSKSIAHHPNPPFPEGFLLWWTRYDE